LMLKRLGVPDEEVESWREAGAFGRANGAQRNPPSLRPRRT
jgi:hypothetical protein